MNPTEYTKEDLEKEVKYLVREARRESRYKAKHVILDTWCISVNEQVGLHVTVNTPDGKRTINMAL